MQITLIAQIEAEDDILTLGEQHELANTLRRTVHAIEGGEPLEVDMGGSVLDRQGKMVGAWSVE